MPANCICQDLAYLLLSTHHFLLLSGCNKSTHPLLTLDARHHLVNVAGSSLSPHFSIFPHITYNIYVYRLGAFRHIIFYVLGGDSDWEISIISPRQWLSFPPSLVFFLLPRKCRIINLSRWNRVHKLVLTLLSDSDWVCLKLHLSKAASLIRERRTCHKLAQVSGRQLI